MRFKEWKGSGGFGIQLDLYLERFLNVVQRIGWEWWQWQKVYILGNKRVDRRLLQNFEKGVVILGWVVVIGWRVTVRVISYYSYIIDQRVKERGIKIDFWFWFWGSGWLVVLFIEFNIYCVFGIVFNIMRDIKRVLSQIFFCVFIDKGQVL